MLRDLTTFSVRPQFNLQQSRFFRALKLDARKQSDAWRLDCRRRTVHCRRTRRVQRHATSVISGTFIRAQVYACLPGKCSSAFHPSSIPVLSKCSTDVRELKSAFRAPPFAQAESSARHMPQNSSSVAPSGDPSEMPSRTPASRAQRSMKPLHVRITGVRAFK